MLPILARTELTQLGKDWKSLSRLLLEKGISWSYEKEVRLLVDLDQARDLGKKDADGWAVMVIDPPSNAIREIYSRANTRKTDVEPATQAARGVNTEGLFAGSVYSHEFRVQKTCGVNY